MKAHTMAFKEQIKNLGRQFDNVITYGNTTLNEELYSVNFVYEGNILKSIMKELDIESSINIPIGTTINYKIGLLVNNSYEYLNYGNYIVKEVEKEEDKNLYKITCYDKMLYSMTPYVGVQQSFPMTIREYMLALCNKLGISFANAQSVFANYNRILPSDPYVENQYTYRDIFDELAQATASTICINNSDKLEVRYITETNDVINEEYLKDVNVNFSKKYGPINSIVLSRTAGSDNVYLKDDESIQQNGLCEIKISDNQIMNGNDRSDYLPDILNKLNGMQYYLNDFSSTGILYYDICDRYSVQVEGNIYSCVMLNDNIDITSGVVEQIYTDLMEQGQTDYEKADKTDRKINQTYLIVDKQNQKIESVVNTVTQQNSKISQITQTVDELNTKIQDIADITTAGETSYATLNLSDINQSEPIMIKIHPIMENISYLYPNTGLYPSSSTYLKTRKLKFIRTYEEDGHTLTQEIDYILPDDLLWFDNNTYDEFYLDYDSKTCEITKRCGYNANGEVYVLSQEVVTSYAYPEIMLGDGDYEIKLIGYNNAYIYARLVVKNIYTAQFATKVEMSTEINQTAQEINLSVDQKLNSYPTKTEMNSAISITANNITSVVSRKVGEDEIISKINQSAESITIDANKISLSGKTINLTSENINIRSTNFGVDSDGNLTANNAKITGTVTATSGYFDNCTIANSCTVPASTVVGTLSDNTIPNLSASKITSGTMSANRISGGSLSGLQSISAPIIAAGQTLQLDNRFGKIYVGGYSGKPDDGNAFQLIVQHNGNEWKRLTFRCGILVNIESQW